MPPLILVVEDEPLVQRVTCHFLEAAGYRCLSTATAAEAIAVIEGGQEPDLLVLDVRLPDLSGPELALRLREHRPNVAVLFVSGWVDGLQATTLEPLSWKFLPKPFTGEELVKTVQQMVPLHSGETSLPFMQDLSPG